MKKLLIGLLTLGSISSFAECDINFLGLKYKKVIPKVREMLEQKGYRIPTKNKYLKNTDFLVGLNKDYYCEDYNCEYFYLSPLSQKDWIEMNSYKAYVKVSHKSGFIFTSKEVILAKRDYIITHPKNFKKINSAAKAPSVAERNRILSQLDPSLDTHVLQTSHQEAAAQLLPSCQELLGENL
jgi:hypothetical protein